MRWTFQDDAGRLSGCGDAAINYHVVPCRQRLCGSGRIGGYASLGLLTSPLYVRDSVSWSKYGSSGVKLSTLSRNSWLVACFQKTTRILRLRSWSERTHGI